MTQRGPSLVRFSLFCLVFGAFALALLQPAQAGTAQAPEVADPAGDQELLVLPLGTVDEAGLSEASDLRFGWVTENATHLFLNIQAEGDIDAVAIPMVPVSLISFGYTFALTVNGTDLSATLTVTASGPAAGGIATAVAINGTVANLTVPKSALPVATPGTVVSGLAITSSGTLLTDPFASELDRAPNEGSGLNYTITGGAGGTVVDPDDTDGDGLPDDCEIQYAGDLTTSDDAPGDFDGDGLSNAQECALGTDPTDPDSDDDGTPDGSDTDPTDPTKGGTGSGTSSSTTSTSRTTTTSRPPASSTASTSSAAQGNDPVDSLDEVYDRLSSDAGYLGFSSGGFLAVVILAILGLAVRWSL